MNIKMLVDMRGSNDGPTVKTFKKDEEYTVGKGIHEDLADVFIREGWAEIVGEQKDNGDSPENKNAGGAPANKGESGNDPNDADKPQSDPGDKQADAPLYPHTDYSESELETMSMAKLREIGDPLGAKDTKKLELLKEILLKQKERREAWEKENI